MLQRVANNDDGVNTVGWGPAAQPDEQWGETFWRLDDRWIEEADVRMNTVFEWDEARLQSVLRHESGHVLGLTHSTDPEAAMNPYLSPHGTCSTGATIGVWVDHHRSSPVRPTRTAMSATPTSWRCRRSGPRLATISARCCAT